MSKDPRHKVSNVCLLPIFEDLRINNEKTKICGLIWRQEKPDNMSRILRGFSVLILIIKPTRCTNFSNLFLE